jgi:hypothetical protein
MKEKIYGITISFEREEVLHLYKEIFQLRDCYLQVKDLISIGVEIENIDLETVNKLIKKLEIITDKILQFEK